MPSQPQLHRASNPKAVSDKLRQMQHRHIQIPPNSLSRKRLLQIEIQMTQRTRSNQAISLSILGIPKMRPGLLQRSSLVHGDDREPAALAHTGVIDDGPPKRLDDLMQIAIPRMLRIDPKPIARPHDVAPIKRPNLQIGKRPLDEPPQILKPDLLNKQPREVLIGKPLLV